MSDQHHLSPDIPDGATRTDGAGELLPSIVPFTMRRRVAVPTPPPTTLVGRSTEIRAAVDQLCGTRVRLLTLTGPGGIGKTRLAQEIAAQCDQAFRDGIAWVSLAPIRDPERMAPAVQSALGIGDVPGRASLDTVAASIRTRHLLLILDNFEQIVTAASQLTELLRAAPGLTVLVTSRSPLRISGEHVLPVPPLSLPQSQDHLEVDSVRDIEAVRLFIDRAVAVAPAFELDSTTAPLIAGICQELDGLPLAIELAAARNYHLSVQALHDRLDSRLSLLTSGPRDAPARLQTLRNTIAWSYDLLAPEEQALFRQLAVFAGGFTIEAVEAVCDDGATPLDHLTALVDKSLVQHRPDTRGDARYALLETIREFAAEQLAASGVEPAIRQRHATYYLRLGEAGKTQLAWGMTQSWAEHLEADLDNLRAALDWLAESGQWLDCLRLVTALSRFWDSQGYLHEGRAWLERALDPAKTGDAPPALRATAVSALGRAHVRRGELDLAEAQLEEARALWLRLGDTANLAPMVLMLGGIAAYRGDQERAQQMFEQALALFDEIGDASGVALALNNLADMAYRHDDLDRAEALARKALDVSRETGLPYPISESLITAGAVACARGDLDRALTSFGEALRVCQEAGFQLLLAGAIAGLAAVATAAGDAQRAGRLLGAVDALAEQMGVPLLEHDVLHDRAIAATRDRLGDAAFDEAVAAGRALTTDEMLAEAEAVGIGSTTPIPGPFTPREREVLQLLVSGQTDRAIGEALFIGTRTVESHVAHIFEKLGVRTRADAAGKAIAEGYVDPSPPRLD